MNPAATPDSHTHTDSDPIEALAHQAPVVLPLVGAALMFILALIAVNLA